MWIWPIGRRDPPPQSPLEGGSCVCGGDYARVRLANALQEAVASWNSLQEARRAGKRRVWRNLRAKNPAFFGRGVLGTVFGDFSNERGLRCHDL